MKIARRKPVVPRIEISPLIDCVFLLLIFFILSARITNPTTRIELPRGTKSNATTQTQITVSVNAEGRILFEGHETATDALVVLLKARLQLADEGKKSVVVQGDSRADFGAVFKAMEAARQAGATAVEVAYQPAGE